jgi:hypothetical protein
MPDGAIVARKAIGNREIGLSDEPKRYSVLVTKGVNDF